MSPTVTSITTTLRRQRGMTPEAAAAAVDQACRRLRLPTIRAVLDEATNAAEREQLTYGLAQATVTAEVRQGVQNERPRRLRGQRPQIQLATSASP